MQLTGEMLIGASAMRGTDKPVQAIEAQTGKPMEPSYGGGSAADVDRACELAWAAFDTYRETSLEDRARFLEAIASNIMDLGDALIERTMAESGLPRGRIEGERGRTTGQLRLFAEVVREGSWLEARIDPPLADRKPLPRVDLRQRHIAVGPVAVFGASNFPLAFSVAGGDTASALAAGCPVVVKAHSAHPGTSEMVGRAIQAAVQQCGLPEGTFSLLYGSGAVVGQGVRGVEADAGVAAGHQDPATGEVGQVVGAEAGEVGGGHLAPSVCSVPASPLARERAITMRWTWLVPS